MIDETIIKQKADQLLAELRANPDWAIDERNFKQGYLKALPIKKEGKVTKASAKTKEARSSKKIATVRKSRR